jgi:hypothetical protein
LEPDTKIVQQAATALAIKWTVASTKMQVLDPFGVKLAPATVWIDRDGKIIAAASGPRTLKFFEARTKELLE